MGLAQRSLNNKLLVSKYTDTSVSSTTANQASYKMDKDKDKNNFISPYMYTTYIYRN